MCIEYTPIQKRLMKVLKDGKLHTMDELFKCLEDDWGTRSNVRTHLTILRRKLRTLGKDVITELIRGCHYYRYVTVEEKYVD